MRNGCSTEIERMLKRSIPVAAADGIPAERAPAHAERAPAHGARESRRFARAAGRARTPTGPRSQAGEAAARTHCRGAAAAARPCRRRHPQSRPAADRASGREAERLGDAGSPSHGTAPASRKSHPIPALLMKRTARRAGKGLAPVFPRFRLDRPVADQARGRIVYRSRRGPQAGQRAPEKQQRGKAEDRVRARTRRPRPRSARSLRARRLPNGSAPRNAIV